jgi:hypothetical protein
VTVRSGGGGSVVVEDDVDVGGLAAVDVVVDAVDDDVLGSGTVASAEGATDAPSVTLESITAISDPHPDAKSTTVATMTVNRRTDMASPHRPSDVAARVPA